MATNWALYRISQRSMPGQLMPAREAPRIDGQKDLADNTNSSKITVGGDTAALCVTVDLKSRIDIRQFDDAASLDPTNSPEIIQAGDYQIWTLPQGEWILKALEI